MSTVPQSHAIRKLFADGDSYKEIASKLKVSVGTIAGRCRRMGLKRGDFRIAPPSDVGPALGEDQRDLEILSDLSDGHTMSECARYWSVSYNHVRALKEAWEKAA